VGYIGLTNQSKLNKPMKNKKDKRRVLVMSRSINNELWSVEYSGRVLAETNDMYLVLKDGFLSKVFRKANWIPKSGYLMRCEEIN